MIVHVELDADPPRLRREDGLTVCFPLAEGGGFQIISMRQARAASASASSIFEWRGFHYQELHPGKHASLLVGHLPGGGYCSAAVTMTSDGVVLEFADRVSAVDGMQRIEIEFEHHPTVGVEHSTTDGDAVVEVVAESTKRLTISRPAGANPLVHRHFVRIKCAPRP